MTAADDGTAGRLECWCCGCVEDSARVVHLGNHPEVTLCLGCVRWAAKQADSIDDLSRSGVLVRLRSGARAARQVVVQRGWHRRPVIGPVLRRLGKQTP